MTKHSRSKRTALAYIFIFILLLLSSIFYVASRYKRAHFGDAKIDEILFYFTNGLLEGQSSSLAATIQDNILLCIIVLFLLLLPVIDFYRNRISISLDLSFLGRKKKTVFNPSKVSLRFKLWYSSIVFVLSLLLLFGSFGIFGYLNSMAQSSTLFKDRYVEPRTATLTFPEKKRNLIYIFLESMENTMASKEHGGQFEQSRIPELEALALDSNNISFSQQESGLGGAMGATGTTWTVGSMVGQSSGLPLKSKILGTDRANEYGDFKKFLPGAYTLGDILQKEGYNQTFIMGSEASFGGRDKLLKQHGNYTIKDYAYAKEHGLIAPDYHVWWGYEDKKLFAFAKTELNELSQKDEPFNLQLLTVDTHFTDGWLDPSCATPHQAQYDNVYACSSKQVSEFIAWVQQQPYADNTTIILTGDHVGMQTSYYDEQISSPNYQRTTYNLIINPVITPLKRNARLFSQLDMYPTTLAAMGVTIEGDRLGLGVNLFSEQQTLVEQYGSVTALNTELEKQSTLYDRKILAGSND